MKQYPTLYARSNTGKVLEWFMEQNGNGYRTISGQQDGEKVVSQWTYAEPKNVGKSNETTAKEQAALEIEARYVKQQKSGGYFSSISDIDKERFFQPMLAKSFEDYADEINWKSGVAVQIKYNGGRVIAKADGLWSRKGEKYISIPHIEAALAPFFKKYPNAVLDGEGFNYEFRQNLKELMKLLRRTVNITPALLKRSAELVKFYVYDGYNFGGSTEGDCYLKRKEIIDAALEELDEESIRKVPTWIVYSKKQLDGLYQNFLKDEQEGAIIRILGQGYQQKRTKFLLKYKPVDDDEFRIVDVLEGEGNWAGTGKVIICEKLDKSAFLDGKTTFNATFKGPHEEASKFLKQKNKYIGKVVTLYYNGLTGFGKPNYARFDIDNYDKGH